MAENDENRELMDQARRLAGSGPTRDEEENDARTLAEMQGHMEGLLPGEQQSGEERERPDMPDILPMEPTEPGGVLGYNVETKRKIVEPLPQDDGFRRMPPSTNEPARVQVEGVDELLSVITKSSDFRPFVIPSRGMLYEKGTPLACEQMQVRPFRSGEEEIVATPHMFVTGDALEAILKRCSRHADGTPLEDPGVLLSLDRTALMIAIRALTYGPTYPFAVNCGSCGEAFEGEADLDNGLEVYYLEEALGIKEPMRTVLPRCGLELVYRFGRGSDERQLIKLREERSQRSGGKATENTLHEKALMVTLSIGGISDRQVMQKALSALSGEDLHHLRQCVESPPFGVDTRITLRCPHCLRTNRTRMPFGIDFFMPPIERPWRKS